MSGFRVTPEQLTTLSARVSTGAGSIQSEQQSLAGALAPLGSDWAGVAQTRFQSLWDEWQRSAQGMNHALTGISELMSKAGEAYAQAESSVAASFAGS